MDGSHSPTLIPLVTPLSTCDRDRRTSWSPHPPSGVCTSHAYPDDTVRIRSELSTAPFRMLTASPVIDAHEGYSQLSCSLALHAVSPGNPSASKVCAGSTPWWLRLWMTNSARASL